MINVCVFEDDGYQGLLPLTFSRPAYDLLLGMDSLYEKVHYYFQHANISLHCRSDLKGLMKQRYPDLMINHINTGAACLFVNGRVVMTQALYTLFSENKSQYDLLYTHRGQVVAAYLHDKTLDAMKQALETVPTSEALIALLRPHCVAKELDSVTMIDACWDLIGANCDVLRMDFAIRNLAGIVKGDLKPFVSIYNENNVFVGKECEIEDFVVIDARKGPVFIEENVYIQSGSRLEGPLYIGANSQVLGGKMSTSSIGPYCKVSGEVSKSVLLRYSNKAHFGYLGHSYVGEWVNMGAGSTTSNLKGTYGKIRVEVGEERIDTGQIFLGSMLGDYVKTGIGTLLTAGTMVGFGSHIFGSDFHEKQVPAFSWGKPGAYETFDFERFISVALRMMGRRGRELNTDEQAVLQGLFAASMNGQ